MKKKAWRTAIVIAFALTLANCATGGVRSSRGTGNKLTADEIARLDALTAFDAVRLGRPQWLTARGSGSMGNPVPQSPVVYLDGVRMGDVEELQRIRVTVVREMEFLSASDATNRFGTNHTGGAILVTTR